MSSVFSTRATMLPMMFAAATGLWACSGTPIALGQQVEDAGITILLPDEIDYVPLNPARGDAAPQAGMLWGNLREDVPTGMILKFADGFASPPHIHNITYRGIVIDGALHNDDPDAANMWMEQGSFWMQPAGEVHVTSARPGAPAIAFLEILEGPYLVEPGSKAFDNGQLALNIDRSNIVWLGATDMIWQDTDNGNGQTGPEFTVLWGSMKDGEPSGSLVKLSASEAMTLTGNDGPLDAVIIQGQFTHEAKGNTGISTLPEGGYLSSPEGVVHNLTCVGERGCLIYVRTENSFEIAAAPPSK